MASTACLPLKLKKCCSVSPTFIMPIRARGRNVGWRIDYFFVAVEMVDRVADAFILPEVPGSDHCPVGLRLRV